MGQDASAMAALLNAGDVTKAEPLSEWRELDTESESESSEYSSCDESANCVQTERVTDFTDMEYSCVKALTNAENWWETTTFFSIAHEHGLQMRMRNQRLVHDIFMYMYVLYPLV